MDVCDVDDSVTKKLLEIPFSTRIIAEKLMILNYG